VSTETSELAGSSGGSVPSALPGGPGTSTDPAAPRPAHVPPTRTAPVRPVGMTPPPGGADAPTQLQPAVAAPARRGGGKGWLAWVPEPETTYRPATDSELAAIQRGASAETRMINRSGSVSSLMRTIFRLPKMEDPNPGGRHLLVVCGWAVALGVLGLLTAIRAFIAMYTTAPAWYGPAVAVVGLIGTALTISALFAVQWHRLARLLLVLASAALLVVIILTGLAV
jgi:hypothetical protein